MKKNLNLLEDHNKKNDRNTYKNISNYNLFTLIIYSALREKKS